MTSRWIEATANTHLTLMNEFMKKIDARKITILKIIVEEYIEFGGIT